MLETQRNVSDMSEGRANEIVNFLEKNEPTKFGNVKTPSSLMQLADIAYKTLDRKTPSSLNELVHEASRKIQPIQERIGLDIGPKRSEYLIGHLLGNEDDPHFRKTDDIYTKREVFRKAAATVARFYEELKEGPTSGLIVEVNKIIDEKYPIVNG
ncbi:hypothetical protein C0416_01500 [bacterium]|nr:hypothetical protein [bacterium]